MTITLRNKLILSFAAVLVLMGLMGGIIVNQFATVNQLAQKNYTHGLIGTRLTGEIITEALSARERLLLLVSATKVDEKQRQRQLMQAHMDSVQTLLQSYEPLIETPGTQAAVTDFQQAWEDYTVAAEEVVQLSLAGETAQASLALREEAEHRVQSAIDHLLLVQDIVDNLAENRYAESQRLYQRSVNLTTGMTVATLLVGLGLAYWLGRTIGNPLAAMAKAAEKLAEGDLGQTVPVSGRGNDEIAILARAFNDMTVQLRDFIGSLEQRVADRTRDLAKRSTQLETAAQVGRVTASILDPEDLIPRVVELIREQFGLYYVGLFQVDAAQEWAILQAGTGEAGEAMLAREHKLKIGGKSTIGWSVAHGQTRIAQMAEEDAVRLTTTELPATRAEAALPLRSRGQVIGALTVQSDQPDAFGETFITVLQTVADQVAVAIDNARLFAEAQKALDAERRAYGEISRQAWSQLIQARESWGYRWDQEDVAVSHSSWTPEMKQAAQNGSVVLEDNDTAPTVAVPVQIRDQIVGALSFCKRDKDEVWSEREIELLQKLTDQLSQALENARLHQDTQRRAAQEQLLGEATARIRETLDVDAVLKTAVREMRGVLGLAEVEIQMGSNPELINPHDPKFDSAQSGAEQTSSPDNGHE